MFGGTHAVIDFGGSGGGDDDDDDDDDDNDNDDIIEDCSFSDEASHDCSHDFHDTPREKSSKTRQTKCGMGSDRGGMGIGINCETGTGTEIGVGVAVAVGVVIGAQSERERERERTREKEKEGRGEREQPLDRLDSHSLAIRQYAPSPSQYADESLLVLTQY